MRRMLLFWVVAGVLAAGAAGLILFRAARGARPGDSADPATLMFRRQLRELDELADRGLIPAAERDIAYAEAARRLLSASETPDMPWTPDAPSRRIGLLCAAAAPALALGLYVTLGAPGTPDQPYARRLAAWRAGDLMSLPGAQIAAVLRQVTAERPDDPEGFRLLALAEGAADNAGGAVRALRRATALAPERAELWQMLGEALVFRAGGTVDAAAEAALREALRRDPANVPARYFLAEADFAAGRKAEAASALHGLLTSMSDDDPRRERVQATLAEVEGRSDPTPDDPQMTAIRGMVAGLAARLETAPDDREGWVRLVRAYAVLGDTAKRDTAYASARARYAKEPEVLSALDAAARAEPMR